MKRVVIICLVLLTILTGCANPLKKEKMNTPISAAKAFVKALTSNNMIQLNQVVYSSQSMPTEEIMSIAKMRKITNMSPKRFSYKIDPKDKNKQTVDVTFKDENGIEDKWKLVFLKNDAGNYQYDGQLSGALLANSTPEEAMNSYIQILIHSANPYWTKDLEDSRSNGVPGSNENPDTEMVQKYKLFNKKAKDFRINKIRVYNNGNGAEVFVAVSDEHSQIYQSSYIFENRSDGFYISGTGSHLKVNKHLSGDYQSGGYQAGTPLKAAKAFVQGISYGSMPQSAVHRKANLKEILTIADSRNITGMKTKAFKLKDEGNGTVSVSFVPKSGGEDTLQLAFVKSKSGNYQFDGDRSGALLANSSPQEVAQSYVKALIQNANAFELKSLTSHPSDLVILTRMPAI